MKAARTWLGIVLALGVVSAAVPGGAGAAVAPPSGTTYVSDIPWTSATNGWGPVEINTSNGESAGGDGRVITLNGVTYQKGLGAHAVSTVKYYLGKACQLFQADVGVDDEVVSKGSVVFRLLGDGAQLYDSGTMTGTSATKTVSVDVTDKVELELALGDSGNGKGYDHADWANARVTCGGASETTPPTVTQTTPTGGASGVSTNASPTATFSEPVQTSTVTASTITLVKQGTQTPVAAVVTYNSPSNTATLDPSANLDPSSTYVATVKGGSSGVRDLAGNALAQDYVWTFTTSGAAQTTTYLSDLTWTSATNGWGPVEKDRSNGESAAGDGRVITLNGVTFQKGLGAHALSDIVYDLGGGCSTVEASVGVDDEVGTNGSLIFRVYGDGALLYDSGAMTGSTSTKTVNVSVAGVAQLRLNVDPNGVKSYDHADWANARVTCGGSGAGDSIAPTVTQSVPGSGATGVATNASPTATFSEPVQSPTVTTSTLTLVDQATQTSVAAAVTYNAGNNTAMLDPTVDLSPSTTYVARVKGGSSGVKDMAGLALAQDYVWTFTTGSGASGSLFAAPTPYAAGTNPHGVVAADLNADGKRDLVVANAGADSVSIRLGNGSGTFGAASTFVTGTRPKNAAAADVNGDGKPDLVTANQNANSLSVLLGNGNGTFQAKVDYATCSKPHEVAAADVSGDGKRDLAVACWGGSVINVLLGNGDGTFAAPTSSGAGSAPHSIVIEDFNADGKGDLAVANHSSNNVSVLLGNGNGTFQASVNYAVGTAPHSVRAGDLNGDGRLDLVTANDGSDNVSVLLGNGNGTFQAASNYGAGKVPKSVAIADLNGDGKQDVVTANTAGNGDGVTGNPDGDNVSVLFGSGNGSLGAQTKYTVGLTPFSVFAADLNGDDKPDLITANWDANTTAVLLHT